MTVMKSAHQQTLETKVFNEILLQRSTDAGCSTTADFLLLFSSLHLIENNDSIVRTLMKTFKNK